MRDIVVPNGNEEDFRKMAKELGYDELVFLYTDKKSKSQAAGMKKKGQKALLVKNSNEISKSSREFLMIADGIWAFHDKRTDVIYNLEKGGKDFMHHRRGMNQVMAKQARDNDIKVGFNFGLLLNNQNADIVVGRMKQQVKLCRKYKVKMTLASFATDPFNMRAPKDLVSVGVTLGMHPKEAKNAIDG